MLKTEIKKSIESTCPFKNLEELLKKLKTQKGRI